MIRIITLFLSAIAGMLLANMIMYAEDRRDRKRTREKQRRKALGKKWYED